MKKLLFLFAALLQTALVMAQQPPQQQMLEQKSKPNSAQPCLKNTAQSTQKANRLWFIISDQEEVWLPDRQPISRGAKTPMPRIFYQYK
ncbi:hypothetical protein [Adhaeribacter terreus]|uniref:Uncharacterized protein n=1 Tax=Adhaeribacter terreus TaxID=529703 RepID=A0ABW0E9E3_9BACT